MISNEQGRCCGHVAYVGIRDIFGVLRDTVRMKSLAIIYFAYLSFLSLKDNYYVLLYLLYVNNFCAIRVAMHIAFFRYIFDSKVIFKSL